MAERTKRPVRRLVLRFYAERYLILLLVSFALSVSITRLFLEITGYPQIGNSELHLAHVLWGGLIWFAGSLLPLLFANKRAFDLSALLIGTGSGLFMDEVGKFITATNDYFYPAAAPIIYAFFMLTILIFQIVRKQSPLTARERLYRVIEQFEELIEGDLSEIERDRFLNELSEAKKADRNEEIQELADSLLDVIKGEEKRLVPHRSDLIEKIGEMWSRWMDSIFHSEKKPRWLFIAWAIFGLISIVHPVASVFVFMNEIDLPWFVDELLQINLSSAAEIRFLETVRLFGEGTLGLVFLLSALLGALGKEKTGANLAFFAGLTLLVMVNLLVFYYDQFSAIIFTLLQLAVFLLTSQYRRIILAR